MAEEIKKTFSIETTFVKGFEGSFEVILNGETIYSKLETGELPEPEEIIRLIKEKQGKENSDSEP